ncbi:hypothetical protein EYF80_029964 [Liparis tanakae]|uniref:Uncharacterized protein n=1 Tax=Liparis tanakae TaxID=230148 RepID=A0A4Z2H1Y2_9TELE|nr:hypothetical protein EYF80_029964 [Liparis tanakae]
MVADNKIKFENALNLERLENNRCTRAVTTTAFLVLPATLPPPRDVIVTTYTAFPARLWHSTRNVQ